MAAALESITTLSDATAPNLQNAVGFSNHLLASERESFAICHNLIQRV